MVSGVMAYLWLGAGGFYTYINPRGEQFYGLRRNWGVCGILKNLQIRSPTPGKGKINNTELAKERQQKVKSGSGDLYWKRIFEAHRLHPGGQCLTEAVRLGAQKNLVDSLQPGADSTRVSLPATYDFSFSARRPLVKFACGGLGFGGDLVGEVGTISETIFRR